MICSPAHLWPTRQANVPFRAQPRLEFHSYRQVPHSIRTAKSRPQGPVVSALPPELRRCDRCAAAGGERGRCHCAASVAPPDATAAPAAPAAAMLRLLPLPASEGRIRTRILWTSRARNRIRFAPGDRAPASAGRALASAGSREARPHVRLPVAVVGRMRGGTADAAPGNAGEWDYSIYYPRGGR